MNKSYYVVFRLLILIKREKKMCFIMLINRNSKFVAYFDMLHTNRTINSKSRLLTDLTFLYVLWFLLRPACHLMKNYLDKWLACKFAPTKQRLYHVTLLISSSEGNYTGLQPNSHFSYPRSIIESKLGEEENLSRSGNHSRPWT